MKAAIAYAAVFVLASSLPIGPVQARHHRHHHKHERMTTTGTTGMGANGPSGPGLEPGATDRSRPGGQDVNTKGPH